MSCTKMENRILGYVDGRLKESERLEMEKHLVTCAACQVRVNEFRAVSGLLDELPVIEPSAAFDVRVRARVAAEPVKQSWWSWATPSPRVAFAASMLLLAMVWLGMQPPNHPTLQVNNAEDLTVLENYDVLSSFSPLTELPPASQGDDEVQQDNGAPQDSSQQDSTQSNQTM
jgi:anti-sigma factor RsiW